MPTAALSWLALCAALASTPGKAVSLLPTSFEGNLEEHWQQQIEAEISDGFAQGDFRLIPRDELGEGMEACRDPACLKELAAVSRSDLVVLSSIRVVEKDFAIALSVADGATGETLATVEDTCGLCGAQEVVEMTKDLASTLRAKLDALAKAKPALRLATHPPGAIVSVDGKRLGTTPMQLELDEGEHVLEFHKRGFVGEKRTITAVSGVKESISVDLTAEEVPEERRSGAWPAGWVLFGAGLAGVGVGATLLAIDERPYRRSCEADMDGDCKNLYDTQTGGIVAMSVGGAALVTGVALVIAARKGRSKPSDRRAQVSAAAGGLTARF